jgi:sialate O-acetylesterase
MRLFPTLRLCVPLMATLAATIALCAEGQVSKSPPLPFLSPVFGDNMVLQRGKPNTLWGWATPGSAVSVEVEGKSASGAAGPDGKWSISVEVPPVGGPYSVRIHGEQDVTLQNILVGDVWLCGGQSNMHLGIGATNNGADAIKAADHPDLRLYLVHSKMSYSPASVPAGTWKVCSPATIAEGDDGGFSAVAYYFARRIQAQLHIPVGLIEDCSGGSPAEAWMSGPTLADFGEFQAKTAGIEKLRSAGAHEYGSFLMHWLDDYDPGAKGETWGAADLDDSGWKAVDVPGAFSELGVQDVPSVCWFRREITLPDPLPPGGATLFLGSIEKMDTTFTNGRWIGASSWAENPRVYKIPAGVLKPGTNLVAIRIFKVKPVDGFPSKPEALRIELGDGSKVPLAGTWRGIVSVDARPPHPLPLDLENYPTMPEVLYNGMIAPLAPLAITGAIWYQGEANTVHPTQYRTLLPALIGNWRALFRQGDFPFYIVSLPFFTAHRTKPGSDGWAELREAQALTAATVPNCGLAVTIDTGDADNIHPKEKKIVGERLAFCALAENYKVKIPDRGPTLAAVEPVPGGMKLHFSDIGGGLVFRGEKLGEFSVAGADQKWSWAEATIDGDAVIVTSASVPNPVAARYAWQGNPVATLYNDAGLPAAPFRTDDWPFGDGRP